MALQKQGYNLNFAQGLDNKTDPKQVQVGKFLTLENSIFGKQGALTKRNGFPDVTTVPSTTQKKLLTLNDSLLTIGDTLLSYNQSTNTWTNKGSSPQVSLSTTVLVSNSYDQTAHDTAIASGGLACTVFVANSIAYYQITDTITGNIVVTQTNIQSTAAQHPRVNVLGSYFIITYTTASPAVRYLAIPIANPTAPLSAVNIATNNTSNGAFDSYVSNGRLFIAWNANDVGGAVRVAYLTSTLVVSSQVIIPTYSATLISVTTDTSQSTEVVWVTYYDSVTTNARTSAYTYANLGVVLASTAVLTGVAAVQISSIASGGAMVLYYQTNTTYSYNSVRTDTINKKSVIQAGVVSSATLLQRGLGLASKPINANNGTIYMLAAYESDYQPTYYLIDSSGNIVSKLAYQNGDGYANTFVLPNMNTLEDGIATSYLIKNLLQATNKTQGSTTTLPVYTQNGVNLVSFDFTNVKQFSVEIAKSLQLTGGMFWQYDGVKPVENGFNVYPENIELNQLNSTGTLAPQLYVYQVCYEWTDGQNILQRSAPSLPMEITLVAPADTITIDIPTLRQTYKTGNNPVRIVIYRWSTAQQTFYQVTSITSPLLNDPTVDSVQYTDTTPDSGILGNNILYTTGGVLENVAPSGSNAITIFKSRVFLIDAEDPNLLRYSQPVVQNTPVEFNDGLTVFVAPTDGAQGYTGPMRAISAMDDKLIIFKRNSIYYMTGDGPDLTGANNNFSAPTFITSTIGTTNPDSIVFMPRGIMFQTDKGIWLLDRSLQSSYIGANVEKYNDVEIVSALTIPGTNEVRFTLADGNVLMYDYYYDQWGTFTNIPAVTATLWQNKHTYLNQYGKVRQELANSYVDGTSPVLLKFTTAWINLNMLQGYQRAYHVYLLSEYKTPHLMSVGVAYDYNPSPIQNAVITPSNYNGPYGSDSLYGGGSPYGGNATLEQYQVYFDRQKCMAVQLTVTESYDQTKGAAAGAGFIMSGMNIVIGQKDTSPKTPASQDVS